MQACFKEAMDVCVRLLSRREHSRQELQFKLQGRGYEPSLIEPVLDRLVDEGWQSDQRYAEIYARNRLQKLYGPLKIQQELAARGVADFDPGLMLEDAGFPDWDTLALEAFVKKYGKTVPTEQKARLRCMRGLQQRGFSAAQINAAIRQLT